MNRTTESVGTSAHLSSVKELLAELDTMKNKGLGARARLDFILDQGSELVEEFDLQDAFDLEARARSKRVGQLDELSSVMTNAEHLWKGGPILSDVKEAADQLFGHLRRFLKDTSSRERKSEIDMLSQIWESSPDVRWMYPCLTAWEGPIYRPAYAEGPTGREYPVAPSPEEPSEEVKELAKQKERLYQETTPKADWERIAREFGLPDEKEQLKELKKAWPDVPERDQAQEKVELEHKAELERLDKSVKEGSSSDQTQLEASEKKDDWVRKAGEIDRGRSSAWKGKLIREEASGVGRVVATMTVHNPEQDVVDPDPEEDVVDHIMHDAWTVALRELTLDDWRFTKERRWTQEGSVLLWHLQTGEARLDLTKLDGRTKVSLRILKDGKLWKHEAELNDDEVTELHLNPIPFVKKALAD